MEQSTVIIKNKKNKGFSLLDSMVALTILGTVLTLYYSNQANINNYKISKIYANQTNVYARDFANQLQVQNKVNSKTSNGSDIYKNVSDYDIYKNQLTSNNTPILLTLNNYDKKGANGLQPCLALYENAGYGMRGIVYYVGDGSYKPQQSQEKMLMRALTYDNGYVAAYLMDNSKILNSSKNKFNNNVISYNGWSPSNSILKYIKENGCGNTNLKLIPNTLIVNMEMFPEFNNRLIAISGLQKSTDQSYSAINGDQRYLPNHIFNNNTLKSNLLIGTKVLLNKDNNTTINISNPGAQSTTLNFGNDSSNDNNTAFLTSAIQPNVSILNGAPCSSNDVGKIAIEQNTAIIQGGNTSNLSRNLVSCSYNTALCTTLNSQGSSYCYLSIKPKTLVFNSQTGGNLATNGQFVCPAYAPFLRDEKIINDGATGGYNLYNTVNCHGHSLTYEWDNVCTIINTDSTFYLSFGRSVSGAAQKISTGSSGETYSTNYLTKDYPTNTGIIKVRYGVNVNSTNYVNQDCNSLCSAGGGVQIARYDNRTSAAPFQDTTTNQPMCLCGSGNRPSLRVFAVSQNGNFNGLLNQATCSTTPDYQIN